MRIKTIAARAIVVSAVSVAFTGVPSAQAAKPAEAQAPPPGTICTWGGTAAQPTGTFTITPGLTDTPLATPARFSVAGDLGGDDGCRGTLTFAGQIDASGTCSFNTFEGSARGIPTVTDFAGVGTGPLGPARLYDRSGRVVASENADVNTLQNAPHFVDCNSPRGFSGGNFSSTIVFAERS